MTLVLNDQDVTRVLSMKDCIVALEDAYRDMGEGRAVNTPRRESFMVGSRPDAYYSFKTIEGGLENLGVMAQRINSDLITHPVIGGMVRRVKVPATRQNRYVGLILLYSSETIELLAIFTDGQLQRMRVAGVTGVGVKYLAREDAKVAALLGSGWQAGTAAQALAAVRDLTMLRVFSPDPEHRRYFAEEMTAQLGFKVIATRSAEEAVKEADIVACATNSAAPVVRGEWLSTGMHLTSVRGHEFDDEAWQKSDLIIFSGPPGSEGYYTYGTKNFESLHRTAEREGERTEVEDRRFRQNQNRIYFLSDLLIGKSPRRTAPSQITMMNKNKGLGIEFASVAKVAYERACAAGIGREVPTDWFSQTSHP